MKEGISFFNGTHNFSAFRSSSCCEKSNKINCNTRIVKKNDKIFINFGSKSFLQKQVRSMVGCLKYVGENRWKPEKIKEILKLKKLLLFAPPAHLLRCYLKIFIKL